MTKIRSKRLDGELALLLGGFGLLWVLAGGVGLSFVPYFQRVSLKGIGGTSSCDRALMHPLVLGPLRVTVLEAKLDQLIAADDHEGTLAVTQSLLDEDVRSSRLFVNKAWAHRQLGKIDEATEDYRAALVIEPANEGIFGSLMRMLFDAKRFDQARKEANDFASSNPNAAIAPDWLGWIDFERGNFASALKHYKAAIVLAPKDSWLRNELGRTFERLGEFENGLANYGEAIALDDTITEYKLNRAALFSKLGRHAEAQSDYLSALKEERDQTTILALARSYIDNDKLNSAEPLVAEAINNDPKDEVALIMRVRLRYWQDDLKQMRIAINALHDVDAKSTDVIYWTATLDHAEGRKYDAIKGYKSILNDWSNDYGLRLDLGHALLDVYNPREALKVFEVAVSLAPQYHQSYAGRARAHRAIRNYRACIDDANTSLSLVGRNGFATGNRAYCKWKLGDVAGAQIVYLSAQFLRPNLVWVRSELIELLIEQRLFDRADAEIEAALSAQLNSSVFSKLKLRLDAARAVKS